LDFVIFLQGKPSFDNFEANMTTSESILMRRSNF